MNYFDSNVLHHYWELSSLSTCYCSFVQEANEEEDDDDEPDDEDDDEDDEEDEDGFQMVEPNLNQADIMIVGEGDEFEDVLPTQATTAPEEPEAPPSIMADVDSDGGGRNLAPHFIILFTAFIILFYYFIHSVSM